MNVALLSGRVVNSQAIDFDPSSYRFTLNGSEDITNDLCRADKFALVDDFDASQDNIRLSNERQARNGTQKAYDPRTSTTEVLADQLLNDPLGAPVEAVQSGAETFLKAAGEGAGRSIVPLTIVLIVAGVAGWFYVKGKL